MAVRSASACAFSPAGTSASVYRPQALASSRWAFMVSRSTIPRQAGPAPMGSCSATGFTLSEASMSASARSKSACSWSMRAMTPMAGVPDSTSTS